MHCLRSTSVLCLLHAGSHQARPGQPPLGDDSPALQYSMALLVCKMFLNVLVVRAHNLYPLSRSVIRVTVVVMAMGMGFACVTLPFGWPRDEWVRVSEHACVHVAAAVAASSSASFPPLCELVNASILNGREPSQARQDHLPERSYPRSVREESSLVEECE